MMALSLALVVLLVVSSASAIPKEAEKRVLDHDPLSHASHFENEEHNAQYDHEAFLGEDQAKTFDTLSPEESSRRLGVIYDKIDDNKDGFVDLAELKAWIKFTSRRYVEDDAERQWKTYNPEQNETLHWETYKKSVYGFLDDMSEAELSQEDELGFSYRKMLARDRRRWSVADKDGDDALTRTEFTDFLHPEESPYMRDVVVQETLEDIDKDGDGRLSIEEYIGDMYKPTEDESEEPEWVRNEREIFNNFRDKDKDSFMGPDEVRDWIIPADFDHAEAEARHLIYEADADNDEKLTKDEVLEKYDLFVGSQATDFGEVLVRHDEF